MESSAAEQDDRAATFLAVAMSTATFIVLILICVAIAMGYYCYFYRSNDCKPEGGSIAAAMFESDPTVLARLRDAVLPADLARDTRPEALSVRDFDKGHKGPLIIDVVQSADLEHQLDQVSATPTANGEFVFDTDANEIYEFGSGVDVVKREAPTKTIATAVSVTTMSRPPIPSTMSPSAVALTERTQITANSTSDPAIGNAAASGPTSAAR